MKNYVIRKAARVVKVERSIHLESITCDLCGAKSNDSEWRENSYNSASTTIEMEDDSHYPSGATTTITSFDICPECFRKKLIPWFESQGATPGIKERDLW